jgi:hypothetical protein
MSGSGRLILGVAIEAAMALIIAAMLVGHFNVFEMAP